LAEAAKRSPDVRICAYCLMPNHFHLVLWPRHPGRLSGFMQWLAQTHAARWHAHHKTRGRGHVYQSRFRSFPIQEDGHFLKVCRYVERNPLRANLAKRAQDWRWCSLWLRGQGEGPMADALSTWPVSRPADWLRQVNRAQDEKELAAIRKSRDRGSPYGDAAWAMRTARRLGLQSTLRPIGRPRKAKSGRS
jgi:putative transposase